ncbi:hypothetical protein C2845_PM10G10840 [Panicum miliaceum]|uniref:Uncharacterized protein n=1 Tax=Panicum miliaceum TaxID=4540 RepID=A0A3L6PAX5_PANMI|nr:hypothetical protein C2845_PM10G10840 [Panicum miliaceum]
MCPELLSVPAHTIAAALRFLTEAPCVPEPDLPRLLLHRPRLLVFPVAAWLRPTLFFLPVLASPTCTAAVSRSPAQLQPRAQLLGHADLLALYARGEKQREDIKEFERGAKEMSF